MHAVQGAVPLERVEIHTVTVLDFITSKPDGMTLPKILLQNLCHIDFAKQLGDITRFPGREFAHIDSGIGFFGL